jgi:hypothetical protein
VSQKKTGQRAIFSFKNNFLLNLNATCRKLGYVFNDTFLLLEFTCASFLRLLVANSSSSRKKSSEK